MAKDLANDDDGDLIVNDGTGDLQIVSGADEIAQRIKATLEIRYREMSNIDPDQGADYANFLGKNFKPTLAADDMTASIIRNVPEVSSVNDISFTRLPERHLKVTFSVTATPTEGTTQENVEGGLELGA